MSEITLYWYWTTNPQKVRFALEEMGIPYTLQLIDLSQRKNKEEEYLQINPRGQVPALSIDGQIICESNAILLSLATRFQKLWPTSVEEQSRGMELLFWESGTFSSLAGMHYYNLVICPRIGQEPNIPAIKKAAQKLAPYLMRFEEHFSSGSEFLLSEFSIVDCSFSVWLPHISLDGYPHLIAYRKRLMERKGWTAAEMRMTITTQPKG